MNRSGNEIEPLQGVHPSEVLSHGEVLAGTDSVTCSVDFFARLNRCFTPSEFVDWIGIDGNEPMAIRILLDDPRFVHLNQQKCDGEYFVPERTLFLWWGHFNLRLARRRISRLTARQLAISISSLRKDEGWATPPIGAVDFGKRFGFVKNAWSSEHYVFPLAHIVSQLSQPMTELAGAILDTFGFKNDRDFALKQSLSDTVNVGLSRFSQRTIRVIQAREGLPPNKKMTLGQIGNTYGVTRERIRQIEAKFWNWWLRSRSLEKRNDSILSALLSGFLAEFMRSRGSIVTNSSTDETRLFTFLAKCLGIPWSQPEIERLVVLGSAKIELSKFLQLGSIGQQIDSNIIATELDEGNLSYLADSDLKYLAQAVVSSKVGRLTKADKVYLALRNINEPAHYSEVADVYNYQNPRDQMSARNVHAVLSRCTDQTDQRYGIVWIGTKGTYALKRVGL